MTRYLNAASAMVFAAVVVGLVDALRQAFLSGGADWHSFMWYFPLLNLPQLSLGMALGYMYLSARSGGGTHTGCFLAGMAARLIIFGAAGISGILGRLLAATIW